MFGDVWLGFRRVGRCYEGNLKVWRKIWKGNVARNLQARQKTGKAGSKGSQKLLLLGKGLTGDEEWICRKGGTMGEGKPSHR